MKTTTTMTDSALARLRAAHQEGRIIRGDWIRRTDDGRELVCLLSALSPDVGEQRAVAACPAALMPEWAARLTVRIDDDTSRAAWPEIIARYVAVAPVMLRLDAAAWRRVLAATMIAALDIAAPHDQSGSCARVRALWARVGDGDEPCAAEWAAPWPAPAPAWAATAAAEAADAAGEAATWAAAEAADAAGEAATWAAEAAGAATWAAAWEATWDRLAGAYLSAIEAEAS
jgi:hypothetical protein